MLEFINEERLREAEKSIAKAYQEKRPFRYVIIDEFLREEQAEHLKDAYPKTEDGDWDHTTYVNQNNKFQLTQFPEGNSFDRFFKEINGTEFLSWLKKITEIEAPLIGDPELFGGGLHQSTTGAFLNVHVDYNMHPKTENHRRLNVLVYLNKNWEDSYNGHLELWDLTGDKQTLMERIAPTFNRCVIFETNEISFHGHPKPLRCPQGVTRKSLATYYYTQTRPEQEIAEAHNTIYINTEGLGGNVKKFSSGVKAFLERINKGAN